MISTDPGPDVQVEIFRRMLRIKLNDDAALRMIPSGRVRAFFYSGRGQEVIPAAVSVCLNDDDAICTTYRGVHDIVAKGMALRPLWAEIAGRQDGPCKGKGGPMHISDPQRGVMLTTGIVGSSMPIATGLAWAFKLDHSQRVCIAYFGDGASNIGAFHESLNLASLWKLPVIFVCQNNGFAEHTRYEKCTAVDRVAKRAIAYDMAGITVDGNDPIAMYHAARTAITRARAGEGPTLLEAKTFRFRGHALGDDDAYMLSGEKAAAMQNDPLPALRARLIGLGFASERQLDAMRAQIDAEVEDAIAYALSCAYPSVDELRRDVYASEIVQ